MLYKVLIVAICWKINSFASEQNGTNIQPVINAPRNSSSNRLEKSSNLTQGEILLSVFKVLEEHEAVMKRVFNLVERLAQEVQVVSDKQRDLEARIK
ncbi:hypothetical protein HYV10_01145 [Candidatus Dependentiae bacterium]|nr:hypothetical protein [Candidatus Dependentiae bacterium]